ncbi:MAG: DUF3037 domain-containing protein [Anaerolineales bacterium]|nr:DUF3037 domain-containing protein [Anaerolineales bacterium]
MPALSSFDYAIVRVVPYVERGEFLNAGVILFCRTRRYLGARIELNRHRLAALAPHFDIDQAETHLDLIPRIAEGGEGPIGQLDPAGRFHWLVMPRSTSIQVSEVHTGLCSDPESALEHLMDLMVRVKDV